MIDRLGLVVAVSMVVCGTVGTAHADVIIFNTSDSQFDAGVDNQGWWSATLGAVDSSANYAVGRTASGHVIRNFFTFDLSALVGLSVVDATLELRRGVGTGQPQQTIHFFDVSTDAFTLNNNTGTSAAIFNDLGTGTNYRTFIVPTAGSASDILIFALNAAAIADIQAAAGGFFSIGGSLDPIVGASLQQLLFGLSSSAGVQRLVVNTTATPIPEPATFILLSSGLAALCVSRRRRK